MASNNFKNRTNNKYHHKNKGKITTNNHSGPSRDWNLQRKNKNKTSQNLAETNSDDVISSFDWIKNNNDFSLKLSNLPNNTKRTEIKNIIENLNVKSFHVPKSKGKGRSLKHAFINFWCENDMKFARNIQLQLRNRNLIWLNSSTKTCHRYGKTDHLVKECKREIRKQEK